MRHATIDIELLQPAIISLQSASSGVHQSLDFLPGATLLGHAASRLYPTLDTTLAWQVFHSGSVRFGDALPVAADASTGWPMPLCWHVDKGNQASTDGVLQAHHIRDLGHASPDPERQPAQLRNHHVTQNGQLLAARRQQTLKTAIDPQRGMAADGQLFGYETLSAGQRFRSTLTADDNLPEAVWQQLLDSLSGTARLGRSRSAQFGQARLQARNTATGTTPDCAGLQLTLWLLSDLALEAEGQPCLQPHPHLLGLPAGTQWLAARSFLRQRRYSPYNGWRRHHDPERQVISRGSVLRFQLPHALATEARQALAEGLGLYQEAGLGQVWVNPPLLMAENPQFQPLAASKATVLRTTTAPASAFLKALHARLQARQPDQAQAQARNLLAAYNERVAQARAFDPFAMPPGRSQWGHMKQLASDLRNNAVALSSSLFDPEDGMLRARSGWQLRFGTGQDELLGRWLEQALREATNRSGLPLAELAGLLAVQAMAQHSERPSDLETNA